jgi:AraC family transcriptional regulator
MQAEFGVEETHGILWRRQNRHLASSKGRGWTSIYASVQDEAPYEAAFPAVADHLLILHLGAPVRVARRIGGALVEQTIPTGGIFFMPGNVDFWVRLGGELRTLHLYLRQALFADVAGALGHGQTSLTPILGQADAQISRLALNIRETLDADVAGDGLYADYLGRALAAYLLGGWNRETPTRIPHEGLRRAASLIEDDYGAKLQIEDLAAAAGLSPTHFTRAFRRAYGVAPHQYLLSVRIRHAQDALANSTKPIAQIALDCGFSSQEHLTRLFTRQTPTPPATHRRLTTRHGRA